MDIMSRVVNGMVCEMDIDEENEKLVVMAMNEDVVDGFEAIKYYFFPLDVMTGDIETLEERLTQLQNTK